MEPKEDYSGGERRRTPRIEAVYLLSYINRRQNVQQTPISMGRTLDISPVGARVELFEPIAAGSEMELQIAVAETCVHVRGSVVRVESCESGKYIAGVAFAHEQAELAPAP